MDLPKPAGFEEIRRDETSRMLQRTLLLRALLMPFTVGMILFVAIYDPAWWRRGLLAGLAVLFTFFTFHERYKVAKVGVAHYEPSRNHLVLATAMICFLAVTGGVYSPFSPQVLVALSVAVMTFGFRPALFAAILILTGLTVMALLQVRGHVLLPAPFLTADGRPNAVHTIFTLVTLFILANANMLFTARLRGMSDRMLQRSLQARDEILKNNAEQLRAMTTLSGEIAHELKNPLASVKGLAALAELEPARAPERLRVLRQEIDRMQGILDEFLDFSRPLVPLTQEELDLPALCLGVLELHEGLASDRRITLCGPGNTPLRVRCDRRKVQQILINLVQNAIDASTAGGEVGISVEEEGGEAVVRVLDRGQGIPAELKDRVFDPGVTSKPRGSGLGLTIVRLLAEQHDGSVALLDREGGGCVAELRLKRQGAVEAAA